VNATWRLFCYSDRMPDPKNTQSKKPTKEELKERLTPEQFNVTQNKGTEAPFTGAFALNKDKGEYVCICCQAPLFSSDTKFDSGSGWPSFYEALNKEAINTKEDISMGMKRTEVTCKRCDAHLGHVFEDAPDQPTGLRFCINSAALDLKKKDKSGPRRTA